MKKPLKKLAPMMELAQINQRLKEVLQLTLDCEESPRLDRLENEALFLKETLVSESQRNRSVFPHSRKNLC